MATLTSQVTQLLDAAGRIPVLSITPDGEGGIRLRGLLAAEAGATLRAVLDPLAAPDPPHQTTAGLAPLVVNEQPEHRTSGRTNHSSTTGPVVSGWPTPSSKSPNGPSPTASSPTPPDSDPSCLLTLDLGRSARTATPAQRKALAVRDGGCAYPGCDQPPGWADAHHIQHWEHLGPTDLAKLVLLCGYHHRTVHHDGWEITPPKDGVRPEFVPPPWIDPHR